MAFLYSRRTAMLKLRSASSFKKPSHEQTDENYEILLKNNKKWAEEQTKNHPDFFKLLNAVQRPKILWIGCSDARVPPSDLTGTVPGEIFVHRNVANLVIHTDMNLMSVVQYAVTVLNIPDIIICGHTGCGGVKHALSNNCNGLINTWLKQIKDTYVKNAAELDSILDVQQRERRVVELNVEEAARSLAQTEIIQSAWVKYSKDHKADDEPYPHIHGWVYDLSTGIIKDLHVKIELHSIYVLDIPDK